MASPAENKVKELLVEGYRQRDISNQTGLTVTAITRIAKDCYEYQANKPEIRRKSERLYAVGKHAEDGEILDLMMKGECKGDVAELLGVTHGRIHRVLKESPIYMQNRDKVNKKRSRIRIARTKKYKELLDAGISEETIKITLQLTDHTVQSIKNIHGADRSGIGSLQKKLANKNLTYADIKDSALSDPINALLVKAWN